MEEIKEAEEAERALRVRLNEIKLRLSEKVKELFGMEFHYDIESLPPGIVTMGKAILSVRRKICAAP